MITIPGTHWCFYGVIYMTDVTAVGMFKFRTKPIPLQINTASHIYIYINSFD